MAKITIKTITKINGKAINPENMKKEIKNFIHKKKDPNEIKLSEIGIVDKGIINISNIDNFNKK